LFLLLFGFFVHAVNCVTEQGLLFCLCTLVHILCTLRTQN
jgi:hypothetical protein